jgi:hypothetical protein
MLLCEAATDRDGRQPHAPNVASVKVMKKLGMMFHKREFTNGLDTIYDVISRNDIRPDGI